MQIHTDFTIQGKTVLILGNRSYKNLGDELILLGTIKKLQQQGKKIIVSCYDPIWLKDFYKQFNIIDNIEYIHEFPKGFRSFFKYLFSSRVKELGKYTSADSIIIGGGEILTEESGQAYWYWTVGLFPYFFRYFYSRLKTILFKKEFVLPIYLMGGVQKPLKRINKLLFDILLRFICCFYTRDEESTLLGKEKLKNSKLVMDTSIFAYPRRKNTNSDSYIEKKYIIVNLNKKGENFMDDIIEDCKEFMQLGYTIYYCPVSYGHNSYYNDNIYKKMLEKKLKMTLPSLHRENDFTKFVRMISGAEIVINTRLHLFLISYFIGTKNKVYPYQRKIIKMQRLISENEEVLENYLNHTL